MRIQSTQPLSFIELNYDEHETYLPSVSLLIRIEDAGWQASHTLWFEQKDLVRFAQQLRQIEATREGATRLISMNADLSLHGGGLQLEMHTINKQGHLMIAYDLRRDIRFESQPLRISSITGAFLLDSEFLIEMVRGVDDLLSYLPKD
jgi:hypothetical protein